MSQNYDIQSLVNIEFELSRAQRPRASRSGSLRSQDYSPIATPALEKAGLTRHVS